MLKQIYKDFVELTVRNKISLVFVWLVTGIMCITVISTFDGAFDKTEFLGLIIIAGILILTIYIFISISRCKINQKKILDSALSAAQINITKKQIIQLEKEQLREEKFVHDFNNHMMVVLELLREDEPDEAIKYLKALEKEYY